MRKKAILLPKSKRQTSGEIRIGCPLCSQHLLVSRARVSQPICCPGCFQTIIVPDAVRPPNQKEPS